jgi:hypothetical protein
MSYAYLFKYIIIGDTGVGILPKAMRSSISTCARSAAAYPMLIRC